MKFVFKNTFVVLLLSFICLLPSLSFASFCKPFYTVKSSEMELPSSDIRKHSIYQQELSISSQNYNLKTARINLNEVTDFIEQNNIQDYEIKQIVYTNYSSVVLFYWKRKSLMKIKESKEKQLKLDLH